MQLAQRPEDVVIEHRIDADAVVGDTEIPLIAAFLEIVADIGRHTVAAEFQGVVEQGIEQGIEPGRVAS